MSEKSYIYRIQTQSMDKPISLLRSDPDDYSSNKAVNNKSESVATLYLSRSVLDSIYQEQEQSKSEREFCRNLNRSKSTSSIKSSNASNSISKQLQSVYKLSDYYPGRISNHEPPRPSPKEPPIIHIVEKKNNSKYLSGKDLQKRNILTNAPYLKSFQKQQQQQSYKNQSPSNLKIITKFEKKSYVKKDINDETNENNNTLFVNSYSDSDSFSDMDFYSFSNSFSNREMSNRYYNIPTPNISPIKNRNNNSKKYLKSSKEIEINNNGDNNYNNKIIPPTPFTHKPRFLPSNPKLVMVGGLIYEKSEYYTFPMTERLLSEEEKAIKYCVTPTKWNEFLLKKINQNPQNKPLERDDDDGRRIIIINGKEYKKYEYKTIPIVENHMSDDEKKLKYKIPPNRWNKIVKQRLNRLNLRESKISDLVNEKDILYLDKSEYGDGKLNPIYNSHFKESFVNSDDDYNNDINYEDSKYVEIDGFLYSKNEYKTIDYIENNLSKEERNLKYKINPNDWNKLIRCKLNEFVIKRKENLKKKEKRREEEEEEIKQEDGDDDDDESFETSNDLNISENRISSSKFNPIVTVNGIKYKKSLYKNNILLESMLEENEKKMKYKISPYKWNKMLSNYIIKLENENENENEKVDISENSKNNSIIHTPIQTSKRTNKNEIKEELEDIPPWECVIVKGKKYSKREYVNDDNFEKLLSLEEREKKYSITPKEWRIFLTKRRSEIIKSIKRENNNKNNFQSGSPLKNEIKVIIDNEEDENNYLSD